jgi:hypothetical protein
MIKLDKLKHFFWGAIIGFPLVMLFGIYGLIVCGIFYALKEIVYDKLLGKGNPEIMDWVYGIVPVILETILLYSNHF